MIIKSGEYIGEDCHSIRIIVMHNEGHRESIRVDIVFNFITERVETISVYNAKRLSDLKGVVRKVLYKHDWTADVNTEIISQFKPLDSIVDGLRLDMYYRALERNNQLAA